MKRIKNFRTSAVAGLLALGTVGLLVPSLTLAESKGAAKLMFPASTTREASAAPAKQSSMSCPACSDGYRQMRDTAAKGMRADTTKSVAAHGCASCQTKIVSIGTGKAKTDTVAHSCGNGAPQASCCVAAK
jgi:hypothetical protein